MSERHHPDLRVVRFDDESIDPHDLGHDLYDIVSRNPSLADDFPTLPDRYTSPHAAEAIVMERRGKMARELGTFSVYAVLYGETTIGVATAEQSKLRHRGRGLLSVVPIKVAEGPWVAYWLDDQRPPEQRHVGGPMLRAIASDLTANTTMQGSAFTVVRGANLRSRRILEDTDNGFGGFSPADDEPRQYAVGDGVDEPRWLYVARRSMKELRGQAA